MQNSELKKELLGPHKEVSAKELENYLNGDLSASEARAVESKLHSSEFSGVAADGFETYGSTASITEIGKQWATPNNSLVIWSTVGAVVLVFAGLWAFGDFDIKSANDQNQSNQMVSLEDDQDKISVLDEKDTPTNKVNESTEQNTGVNQKLDKNTELTEPLNNGSLDEPKILFYTGMEEEVFKLKPLLLKEGELVLKDQNTNLKTQKARLRHYRKYKLVDQGIGIDQSLLKPIFSGTEAFKETIEINPKYPEWMPADSVYKASINEAIDWIIDEDFLNAKSRLKRLVQNTPEDLTAQFYMGYTLYLDQNYEQALYYLNNAQIHIIQTFDQDARFIEIKCLLGLGRDKEAGEKAEYLNEIGSFYAERALELVE